MSSNTTGEKRWPRELTEITREGALATSSGTSRFVSRKWPMWLVANWLSQPSAVRASGHAITPALSISRLRCALRSANSTANARTLASDISSSAITSTFGLPVDLRIFSAAPSPFATSRAVSVTRAPRSASARAVSAPRPPEAPVTIAETCERSRPATTSEAVDWALKLRIGVMGPPRDDSGQRAAIGARFARGANPAPRLLQRERQQRVARARERIATRRDHHELARVGPQPVAHRRAVPRVRNSRAPDLGARLGVERAEVLVARGADEVDGARGEQPAREARSAEVAEPRDRPHRERRLVADRAERHAPARLPGHEIDARERPPRRRIAGRAEVREERVADHAIGRALHRIR